MKRLSKEDKPVILKIVQALPYCTFGNPHACYLRARNKFLESLEKNFGRKDARKIAFYDACEAAADGVVRDCNLAKAAIADFVE